MIRREKSSTSLNETLSGIKDQGYNLGFRREAACIYCFDLQERIMPDDFTVDESYYFEDIVNPDSDRMLYAISLSKGGRGFLIDSCNVYSDNISYEMEQKLQLEYLLLS